MLVRSAAGAYYTLGITSRGCEAAKRAAKEEVARTARRRQRVADSASEADRGGSDSAMLVYCCLCLLFVCCPHFPRKRAIQLRAEGRPPRRRAVTLRGEAAVAVRLLLLGNVEVEELYRGTVVSCWRRTRVVCGRLIITSVRQNTACPHRARRACSPLSPRGHTSRVTSSLLVV